MSNLSKTIPAELQLINTFGAISGYKVNNTKSSILLLSSNERRNPISEVIQFSVVEKFKYLGVQILPRLENIVDANYEPLMMEINESIDIWMSLPVSIFGKINILKMNILPKLLYFIIFHFQHLQICSQKLKLCLSDSYGTIGGQDFVCLCCIYHLTEGA